MKKLLTAVLLFLLLRAGGSLASYEKGLEARGAGDYSEALHQWMLTSDDPRCMTAIAALYDQGEGLPRDADRAADWYRRAAKQGNFRAMAQLANYSLLGLGGETKSPMEWRAELEKIRGRDPYADYVLAFFYANAHGGEQKLEGALDLLKPLVPGGYPPFVALYNEVQQRLADRRSGVLDAGDLAREITAGEASFDRERMDQRLVVSGYVNTVKRLNDYGYVMKLGGPHISLVPRDNILAVFYAPLVTDPLSGLGTGDYVKIDGVYLGPHPFDLEPSALTLFGCRLLKILSGDVKL